MSQLLDLISTCMLKNIGQTLTEISKLASPVARSGHVGNNTSNIWGWLALGQNTFLLQFDHTRYGLDDLCAPWVLLANGGRISACFDHRGGRQDEWNGRHITEHLHSIASRYYGIMNYGIRANYKGEDLILRHCDVAARLSTRMNNSKPSFDSAEALSVPSLLRKAVVAFAQHRSLHLCIDRWVYLKRGASKPIVSRGIRHIEYAGAQEMRIVDDGGTQVFAGSVADLVDKLLLGLVAVKERMTEGTHVASADYPWFALPFSYLIQSVKEYAADRRQIRFWHAGGSSSQYYINSVPFQERFKNTLEVLIVADLLPMGASLTMIPTYCSQLFATCPVSQTILDDIVDTWRTYLTAAPNSQSDTIRSLAKAEYSIPIAKDFCRSIDSKIAGRLYEARAELNRISLNPLPIAHAANLRHPTYNKYGVAQEELMKVSPQFPRGLLSMTWAEAELLVKVLAEQCAEKME